MSLRLAAVPQVGRRLGLIPCPPKKPCGFLGPSRLEPKGNCPLVFTHLCRLLRLKPLGGGTCSLGQDRPVGTFRLTVALLQNTAKLLHLLENPNRMGLREGLAFAVFEKRTKARRQNAPARPGRGI